MLKQRIPFSPGLGRQEKATSRTADITTSPLCKGKHMGRALTDMSLQELWELFPIILTPHCDCWSRWYAEEAHLLQSLLKDIPGVHLNHIGSTAIAGIWAKPIIDMLLEVRDKADMTLAAARLTDNGYILMSKEEARISFNKGYTEQGFAEKVFHIHLRLQGDNDELFFRDHLNMHPEIAKAYEALKLRLWKQYEHDRDRYTLEKSAFIIEQTGRAKKYLDNTVL